MLKSIDRITDRVTMYRLVLYYLVALWGGTYLLGLVHLTGIDPGALSFSLILIVCTCWGANAIFCKVFGAVPNVESVFITALILALIIDPAGPANTQGIGLMVFASIWAMASKFVLSLRRRHIFNPAAIGVALPGLLMGQAASWWIAGEAWLLPVMILGGVLLVRKLRRFDLVAAFMAANLLVLLANSAPADYVSQVQFTLLHTPFFFLAFVMLTEPLTAPQDRVWRIAYGVLVGILVFPKVHLGDFYFSPEVALLVGNVLTLLVSPKGRVLLTLERVEQAAEGAYDFIFRPDRPFAFAPGQFLEWTLPVSHPDNRGNRRYFTIASAPDEPQVRLGVKFYPRASAFKRDLAEMLPGGQIVASQLAGSFVLPKNPDRKLVFIAGGIGITPFRSMLKYLLDSRERRDIIVLYGNETGDDIAYENVLAECDRQLGIPTYHALRNPRENRPGFHKGVIDEAMIRRCVPDYRERLFYISGPQAMVIAHRRLLSRMGIPFWHIKTDFFPGLA